MHAYTPIYNIDLYSVLNQKRLVLPSRKTSSLGVQDVET